MQALSSRRTFDLLLRLLHAWNALAIVALIATSQLAEAFEHGPWESLIWRFHIQIGYALVGGLVVRLLWGLVGPEFARWSDLWHPREWAAMLRGRFRSASRFGHDSLASAAFLVLYAILLLMSVTGLVLAAVEFDMGPLAGVLGEYDRGLRHLFKEPHEAGFAVVLGFVALHLGALAFHRFVLRAPVGKAMVTGVQTIQQEIRHA